MDAVVDSIVVEAQDRREQFVNKVKHFLQNNETLELLSFMEEENNKKMLVHVCWDLIRVLSEFVCDRNYKENPLLFDCAEELILKVANCAQPEEAVLEFLEYSETNDNSRFIVMYKAITVCLLKISNIRNTMLWCFNGILRHLGEMAIPDDLKLEKDENIILDNNECVIMIGTVYQEVIEFYTPHVRQLRVPDPGMTEEALKVYCEHIVKFLLQLLGHPLIYCDVSSGSIARLHVELIVSDIICFNYDLLYYLRFARVDAVKLTDSESNSEPEFDNLSLGVFYYSIFLENIGINDVSYVYNPYYVFEKILIPVSEMLAIQHSSPQYKGLSLALCILDRLSPKTLCLTSLHSKVHSNFAKFLTNIMVYSEVEDNRKLALTIFRKYLKCFNPKGRYFLLFNIQNVTVQPGFIGFIATLVKDLISQSLTSSDSEDSLYFQGTYMTKMLFKLCNLHDGIKTDLIEGSDQIISCLNLVRFLVIRDPNNVTGIWDCIPELQKKYLEPIRKGIDISRAHYKLQISEVYKDNGSVSITVGGANLPEMPHEEKIRVLNLAMNTFDLIDSLLSRVIECISLKR